MPRTRPPYPPEFRIEAVRMLRAGVRSPRQLAAELGCSEQTLRNWWRQDQADRGEREPGTAYRAYRPGSSSTSASCGHSTSVWPIRRADASPMEGRSIESPR